MVECHLGFQSFGNFGFLFHADYNTPFKPAYGSDHTTAILPKTFQEFLKSWIWRV